jgi:hypothetical protein
MATPPHFAMPDQLPGDLLDAGLGPDHLGLLLEAWAEVSRNLLDGKLAPSRARKLRTWDESRARDLVIAGAFASSEAGIELVPYLKVNRTRDQIAALREARSQAGRAGGASRAPKDAPRLPDGTLAAPSCPVHGREWRKGNYGYSCPAKAGPGEEGDRRGFCAITPEKVRLARQVSGGLSGEPRQVSGPLSGPSAAAATSVAALSGASAADAASLPDVSSVSGRRCGDCKTPLRSDGVCTRCHPNTPYQPAPIEDDGLPF